MARARNIKAKFFENEDLGSLDPLARLLFVGLWTIADFKGCLEYRPKRIKAQILPYDDCDVSKLIDTLEKAGFIWIYSIDGKDYIKVIKFQQHQSPHKNERDAGSELPDYEEKYRKINELSESPILSVQSPILSEVLALNPESCFLNPDCLILKPEPKKKTVEKFIDINFEKFWKFYPYRDGSSKAKALKQWLARLKEGHTVEEMFRGAHRYRTYCKNEMIESQYFLYASNFLGEEKHFQLEWQAKRKEDDFFSGMNGEDDGRRRIRTINPMARESDFEESS